MLRRLTGAAFAIGLLFSATFAWAQGNEAPLPAGWKLFVDEQAGYEICYPADGMEPRLDLDKDGHRIFEGLHSELRVWAEENPDRKSLWQVVKEVIGDEVEHHTPGQKPLQFGDVTSLQMDPEVAVVSGRIIHPGTAQIEKIFHAKIIASDEKVMGFLLRHVQPEGSDDQGELAARMKSCFHKR